MIDENPFMKTIFKEEINQNYTTLKMYENVLFLILELYNPLNIGKLYIGRRKEIENIMKSVKICTEFDFKEITIKFDNLANKKIVIYHDIVSHINFKILNIL